MILKNLTYNDGDNLTEDQQAKLKLLKDLNLTMEKLKLEFNDNMKRMEIISEELEKLQVYKVKLSREERGKMIYEPYNDKQRAKADFGDCVYLVAIMASGIFLFLIACSLLEVK